MTDIILNEIDERRTANSRIASSGLDASEFVRASYLAPGQALPLVVQPAAATPGLNQTIEWIGRNRDLLNEELLKYGAILFRGFPLAKVEDVSAFAGAISDQLLEYSERSSPRSHLSDRVYTSTDYPPSQEIFLHNEHSYSMTYPMKIFFSCLTPAQKGGETPIADIRRVTAGISLGTRERFERKKWMYMRNFGDGLGLPWQTAFQTSDPKVVEKYCAEHRISFEWKDGNRLRTRQVRPAFARHPRTGEILWFNHVAFFHVSTLEENMREALMAEFDDQDLPNNTYYGDGSDIGPEVMEELRTVYKKELIKFLWEKGDIMVLDNMLTAHGRSSYTGQRKVVVAMAEPATRGDL